MVDIPPSYLRQLAELDFIDDDLEFPIHFNSDLDFWNYYHEKLGAVTFWHVGKDLAKSAAKFDGLAPVSIQLSNIDLADREGNKQRVCMGVDYNLLLLTWDLESNAQDCNQSRGPIVD